MKKIALFTLLTFILPAAACNTMEGAGKDIKTGGQKLEQKAREEKHDNR